VRKIADTAIELTTRNLDYKYGSADPANGGMDCSGFVFYVLTQNGVPDVPRDSSQQYVWVRKAGNFKAVNSRQEDTFELDELVPGDLLFWTGTYNIERDPPITHAMIYLGREKGTNQRIMVGASDGRTYKGESRYGVSVFDFKIPRPGKTDEGRMSPSFIGYGHIPGGGP
jgi:peptidoglycan DL-endopeptidase CwlO